MAAKPLISARTLTRLQGIAERAMPDAVVIVRPVLIDDGAGGTVTSGVLETTTIGSFLDLTALSAEQATQLREHGKYMLRLPLETDIRVTDQVRVAGGTYAVTWAPVPDGLDVDRYAVLTESQVPTNAPPVLADSDNLPITAVV